jgi:exopolysaccharide biosynthesis polyprenyl glycosylphosphotransferase
MTGWGYTEEAVQSGRVDGPVERPPPIAIAAAPRRRLPLRGVVVGCDLFVVALGWSAGTAIVASLSPPGTRSVSLLLELMLVLPVAALLLSANALYRRRICQVRAIEVSRIGRTAAMLSALLLLVLLPAFRVSPTEVSLAVGVAGVTWFALLTFERGLLREWILGRRAAGAFGAQVLVLGGEASSTMGIASFLRENPVLGLEVRGLLCPPCNGVETSGFSWLGEVDQLEEVVRATGVSGAVLDASSLNGQLNPAVKALSDANLHVHISSGLRGIERRRILLSSLADETFLHIGPLGLRPRQRVLKRVVDVAVASVMLAVTSPILLIAAMAIRLTDGAPVLYRQQRTGHEGEPFTLLKLRTMRIDAHGERAALEADNLRDGPLFKLGHDPRVTRVGRLLRATSLDELPQLFNVLEGTMSMVGPRPALPEEAVEFDEELRVRLSVKPGLTGLWQVEARDLPSFDLYRRYDLMYVQNWSLGVDLAILLRTAVVVPSRAMRALVPARLRRPDVIGME